METQDNLYPLTHPQKGIWYIEKLYPGTSFANIVGTFKVTGKPNYSLMDKAINQLLKKNDGLRTRVIETKDGPRQYIADYVYKPIKYLDFSDQPDAIEAAYQWCEEQTRVPFRFINSELCYFAILKVSDIETILYPKTHHLISDAWTIVLLGKQFIAYYNRLQMGEEILTDNHPSYINYIQSDAEYEKSSKFQKDKRFWNEKYATLPQLGALKVQPRGHKNMEAKRLTMTLPEKVTLSLQNFCKEEHLSIFTLFLAVVSTYINRIFGKRDFNLGTFVLNRANAREKNTVGMFINTIPFRVSFDEEIEFVNLARELNEEWLPILRHQKYHYNLLLADINKQHGNIPPLIDIFLSYQNARFDYDKAQGQEKYQSCWHFNGYNPNPLNININDRETELQIAIDYDYQIEIFSEEEINYLHNNLLSILQEAISNPHKKIEQLERLTEWDGPSSLNGKANRSHKQEAEATRVEIASTFTSEPIGDYIKWWANQLGHDLHIEFAGYSQVFQELLNPNSLLSKNQDGINILLVRFEDYLRNDSSTEQSQILKLEQVFAELIEAIDKFNNTAPLITAIFPVSTHLSLSGAIQDKIDLLNMRFMESFLTHRNIYTINLNDIQESYCIEEVFDSLKDQEGHMPFTEEYYAAIGTEVARKICAIKEQHFKVIVLDCDNTLWRGVCGEQGILGVEIEGAYREFQEFLLQKHNEGMLLAICSKNNEKDVLEVFDENPGMVLNRRHISNWKVNWNEKSQNIRAIARELNLGVDSLIFIDDNPVECSKMVENCPEVLTLQLPSNEELIPLFLKHVWAFDRAKVTKEDTLRGSMYEAEQNRKEVQEAVHSLDEFLKKLELKVSMRTIGTDEIERASQLTQRTNQFNLSTIRRSEEEIIQLLQDNKRGCFIVEAADRYGDYGIIGLVILNIESNKLFLDTFLLSCRILGRKVEDAVLWGIRKFAEEHGIKKMEAIYRPTDRNQPILDFIDCKHFNIVERSKNYIRFEISVNDLSEEIEYVGFYYNEVYDRTQEKIEEEKEKLSVRDGQTKVVQKELANITRIYTNDLCDIRILEETMHKHHLLPIKNFTGKRLLQLPICDGINYEIIEYEAPRNEIEERLVAIWETILKTKNIGITNEFFSIGGNSLRAVTVIARIHKEFNVELALKDLFELCTIKKLAEKLMDSKKSLQQDIYTLLNDKKMKNIFAFPPIAGYGQVFGSMANNINEFSLYAFNYLEDDDKIEKYLNAIKSIQNEGPYILIGYSAGAYIVYELSKRMPDEVIIVLLDGFWGEISSNEIEETLKCIISYSIEFLNLEEDNPYIYKILERKIRSYMYYITDKGKFTDRIDRDIYFLQSEEMTDVQVDALKQITTGSIIKFKVCGKHLDLITPGYIEENAKTIEEILRKSITV